MKSKKHTFVRNKESEVTECEECGYLWAQKEKRGCNGNK